MEVLKRTLIIALVVSLFSSCNTPLPEIQSSDIYGAWRGETTTAHGQQLEMLINMHVIEQTYYAQVILLSAEMSTQEISFSGKQEGDLFILSSEDGQNRLELTSTKEANQLSAQFFRDDVPEFLIQMGKIGELTDPSSPESLHFFDAGHGWVKLPDRFLINEVLEVEEEFTYRKATVIDFENGMIYRGGVVMEPQTQFSDRLPYDIQQVVPYLGDPLQLHSWVANTGGYIQPLVELFPQWQLNISLLTVHAFEHLIDRIQKQVDPALAMIDTKQAEAVAMGVAADVKFEWYWGNKKKGDQYGFTITFKAGQNISKVKMALEILKGLAGYKVDEGDSTGFKGTIKFWCTSANGDYNYITFEVETGMNIRKEAYELREAVAGIIGNLVDYIKQQFPSWFK